MLHQLFLEPEGIYLVVFNGQELIVPPGTQLVGTPQRFATEETLATCLEYLSLWLNSIYTFAPGAPVFVVCTCSDLLDDEQQHKIHDMVVTRVLFKTPCRDQVIKCPYWEHDHENKNGKKYIYFVDNTITAGASVVTLREQIEQVIHKHPYIEPHVSMQMPLEWLQVLDKINELVAQKQQQRVTRQAFVEIARECGVGKTRIPLQAEVDGLLEKFHKLGLLAWYDQPLLRDVVVLNPQWLINAATRIIRDRRLHPLAIDLMAERNLRQQLACLYEHARLDEKLLPYVFPATSADEDGDSYSDDERQQLMQLFERFWLAVPVSLSKKSQKTWLIPSLLMPRPDGLAKGGIAGTCTCHLHFFSQCGCHATPDECECPPSFQQMSLEEDGFLPDGLFPRLLGKLTSQEPRPPSDISQGYTRLGSGKRQFSIEHLPRLNAIKLSIVAENPLPAYRRVVRAVDEAIAALGITGRLHHRLLFELGDDFVRHSCLTLGVAADDSIIREMSVAEIRKQPMMMPWFEQEGDQTGHDVFLSYKHGVDSAFAEAVFDHLQYTTFGKTGRRPAVFLDKKCPRRGHELTDKILGALRKSDVAVPLVSDTSLATIGSSGADCDYLLLEYWAMLELYDLRKKLEGADIDVAHVCPVTTQQPLVATSGRKAVVRCNSIFEEAQKLHAMGGMPDAVHENTHRELTRYFKSAGLPVPEPLTTRDIVARILSFEGVDQSSDHSMSSQTNKHGEASAHNTVEWVSDQIQLIWDGCVDTDRHQVADGAAQRAEGTTTSLSRPPSSSPTLMPAARATRLQSTGENALTSAPARSIEQVPAPGHRLREDVDREINNWNFLLNQAAEVCAKECVAYRGAWAKMKTEESKGISQFEIDHKNRLARLDPTDAALQPRLVNSLGAILQPTDPDYYFFLEKEFQQRESECKACIEAPNRHSVDHTCPLFAPLEHILRSDAAFEGAKLSIGNAKKQDRCHTKFKMTGSFDQLRDLRRASIICVNVEQARLLTNRVADGPRQGPREYDCRRCKLGLSTDFDDAVSCGYRDAQLNLSCPGSDLIFELQMHHSQIYAIKSELGDGGHKNYKAFRERKEPILRQLRKLYAELAELDAILAGPVSKASQKPEEQVAQRRIEDGVAETPVARFEASQQALDAQKPTLTEVDNLHLEHVFRTSSSPPPHQPEESSPPQQQQPEDTHPIHSWFASVLAP